jgi:hypothetical protein
MARAGSLLAVAVGIGALACSALRLSESRPDLDRIVRDPAVVTQDGLYLVLWDGPGAVFVKAPRPELYRYQSIRLDEISIDYAARTAPRRSVEEARLRNRLRSSLVSELARGAGWTLVEAPGPAVLTVSISVLDLSLPNRALTNRASTAYAASAGSVAIVVDLSDSVTGEPLLRYAQRRTLPGGVFYDPTTVELEAAERAFDAFAADTRDSIALFHRWAEEMQREEEAGGG